MGKKDLNSILIKEEEILPDAIESTVIEKKLGRRKKSIDERESEPVTIKITPGEMSELKAKAGLVPLGKYIKHCLRSETNIFRKQGLGNE